SLEISRDSTRSIETNSLARRDPSKQALTFRVACDGRKKLWAAFDLFHRVEHELPILRMIGPLAAVVVKLRNLPQPQRIVGEMVVQFDQAGVNRALCIDHV